MIRKVLVFVFFLLLPVLLIVSSSYFKANYSTLSTDELLYYLNLGLDGASFDMLYDAVFVNVPKLVLLTLLVYIPVSKFVKYKYTIDMQLKSKTFSLSIGRLVGIKKVLYLTALLLFSFYYAYDSFKLKTVLSSTSSSSTFIEEEYVDARNVQITFPENKRNLIMIYLESMENTMLSKSAGGGWAYSIMPELESLALNNINFSNTKQIGGALPVNGGTWTIAGLVASSAGIPLKIPIYGNSYTDSTKFLDGVHSLGDILHDEGYNTKFIFGSDAKFGGRYAYYKRHGNHDIFDVNTAINEGKMTEADVVFWGFEDQKLFEWSKEEILKLAAQDKPFNYNLLTVNTHAQDGYLEESATTDFATQYENVHAHSSKQVQAFIDWLSKQAFFDETTIVILGDHLSMQAASYYEGKIDPEYTRTIYNAFLNSVNETAHTKQRVFNHFDLFPTILSSMGVSIEGDRLGLGVNLFSGVPTLAEEHGVDYLNEQMGYNSNFYNTQLLGSDYLDMINSKDE